MPDTDDVWGHTPASSVHGLDDEDSEIEPTPEEDPYTHCLPRMTLPACLKKSRRQAVVSHATRKKAAVPRSVRRDACLEPSAPQESGHRAACDDMEASSRIDSSGASSRSKISNSRGGKMQEKTKGRTDVKARLG